MKHIKLVCLAVALLLVCTLFCGCKTKDGKPAEFVENSPLLIGRWQMTTYVTDAGEKYDFSDKAVFFTYNADGTGEKRVADEVEYTFTYTYDGKKLYTSASYPNGRTALMNDLTTVNGDVVTTYSYDEKATVTLKKVSASATTGGTTVGTTAK